MNRLSLSIASGLTLLLHPQVLFGQPPEIKFERISLEQGLSQSSVFAIAQDHQGFLWFATQDGVNRYDGYNFTVYRHDPLDSATLSMNFTSKLLAASDASIWVGTKGGGANRFDPLTERFERYRHHPNDSSTLSSDNITAITEDTKGRVWVGTLNNGLSVLDIETKKWKRFGTSNTGSALSHDEIRSLFTDREGRVWIGTRTGAHTYHEKTGLWRLRSGAEAHDREYISFFQDERGTVWCATSRGLMRLDESKGVLVSVRVSVGSAYINSVFGDDAGNLWIGTFNDGIIRFNPNTGAAFEYQHDPLKSSTPGSNFILSSFRDRTGVLWFGTYGGITKHAPAQAKFVSFRNDPKDPTSLKENRVRSFCEDRSGSIWVGTMTGLYRFDPVSHTFQRFLRGSKKDHAISGNIVWVVREATKGTDVVIWAGTDAAGLNEVQVTPGHPGPNVRIRQHPAPQGITSMIENHAGDLWIGVLGGRLYRFHTRDHSVEAFHLENYDPANPFREQIVALYEDRARNIWVGALGDGLYRIDSSRQHIAHFGHDPSTTSSLSDENVTAIHEDASGTIWVGTYSGLNALEPTTNHITHFSVKDGLPNDVIYSILEDDRGHLWLSTNRGLSRFHVPTRTFRNFDVSDGLQDNEFNQGAAYRARNGMMYFGGIKGFTVFHPDSIRHNPNLPAVVLTSFSVFNRPVGHSPSGPLTVHISLAKSLRLRYSENVFTLSFAGLEFTNPQKNRYAYMMEGFDEDWVYAGVKREATYTNLDPGEYVFRVKASNNDGVWNEEGTSVLVVVDPPFWMTWWFRGLILVGFILIGPVIYFRRVNALKKERKLQQEISRRLIESQENERKRIAAELHDGLGQDLLIISNRTQMARDASKTAEWVSSQLKEIEETAAGAIQNVRSIAQNLRPYQIDRIGLTKSIESILRNASASSSISLVYDVDPIDNVFPKEHEIHIYRVVQESVNNMLKHSRATEGRVSIRKQEREATIVVQDNGRGFETSVVGTSGNHDHGFGLSGIMERVRIVAGSVTFSSVPARGTTVTIILPLQGTDHDA